MLKYTISGSDLQVDACLEAADYLPAKSHGRSV